MVSYIVQKASYSEFIGLSKDKKPVDAPNGSLFIEMDTDKKFRYDAESRKWIEPGKVAVAEEQPAEKQATKPKAKKAEK